MNPQHLAVFAVAMIHSIVFAQEVVPKKVKIKDEIELHYVERGKGEPIIFIHGLTGDYAFWLRQLEGFERQGYQAISYSRRYNYPNKNKLRPNHSATVEADDLAAFIRELKLKKKPHIVGFSYGAYTALLLVLEHPELVSTVTLAEAPIGSWLEDLTGNQSQAAKAHWKKLMEQGINPTKAAFETGDDQLAMRTMFDCIGGKGAFERLPKFVQGCCLRNLNEMRAIVSSDDTYPAVDREKVRELNVPTLILSGSKSVATSRFTDPELERLIPKRSRKRVVLQGASHVMWVEQPVQCREVVLEFIRDK